MAIRAGEGVWGSLQLVGKVLHDSDYSTALMADTSKNMLAATGTHHQLYVRIYIYTCTCMIYIVLSAVLGPVCICRIHALQAHLVSRQCRKDVDNSPRHSDPLLLADRFSLGRPPPPPRHGGWPSPA